MASLFNEMRARANSLKVSALEKKLVESFCDTPIFVCDFLTPINNTNDGLKGGRFAKIRDEFYQFEAIVSGNESTFLNWQNSTQYTQHDSNGQEKQSYWELKFTPENATAIWSHLITETGSTTFGLSNFGSFGEFTAIKNNNVVQVQCITKVDLTMLTKFYLIPNLNNQKDAFDDNQIYYISNFQNYKDNWGRFTYAEIEFTSLKDELAQSGQTIQQKIKFGSSGQGYCFPKLIFDNYGKITGYTYDKKKALDIGVKTVQIEVVGNYCLAGLEIYGVPLNAVNVENNRIYAPRKLLVQSFKLPIQEQWFQVSSANNEFYYTNIDLTATTTFENWQVRRKQIVGDKQMDYQGIIETSGEETIGTNPLPLTIADTNLVVTEDFLKVIGNKNTNKFNVQPSAWFWDGIQHDDTGKQIEGMGQRDLTFTNIPNSNWKFRDLLNLMSFALSYLNQLPYETNYKISWALSDYYIVGGFLNKITLGFPYYWRRVYKNSNSKYPFLETIPMIINKSMYDFFTSTAFASNLSDGNLKKIPLDVFQTAESTILGAIFGNQSTTTSFTFDLTDKMTLATWDKDKRTLIGYTNGSTVMLNQTNEVNGIKEYYKVGDESVALNQDTKVGIRTDIEGIGSYIITGFGLRGLGDGNIRVTFYKDSPDDLLTGDSLQDSMIFQTIIKSTAGYRNSAIREWFTYIKTDFTDQLATWDKEFTWPEAYVDPSPEVDIRPLTITINEQGTIQHEKVQSVQNGNRNANGWLGTYQFEIYNFEPDGLINSAAIRDAYEKITWSTNLFQLIANTSTILTNIITGSKVTHSDSDQDQNTFLTIPTLNIGDNEPNQDQLYQDLLEVECRTHDNSDGWSRASTYLGVYFDGAKLMGTINTHYDIQATYNGIDISNWSTATAEFSMKLNNGTIQVFPRDKPE